MYFVILQLKIDVFFEVFAREYTSFEISLLY
jgi:hypothetical protein